MNKQTKKLQKLVIVSLNTIEKTCRTMASEFKVDFIPMNMYLSVLDKAKWSEEIENKAALNYSKQYNLLIAELAKEASKGLHTSIDIASIAYMNRIIKSSFNKGIKEKSN